MEEYRKVVKKKIGLMATFNVLAVAFITLIVNLENMTAIINEPITDFIHGFQLGIFIFLQFVMVMYITKYGKSLKNEDKLKKLYIVEHDERTTLIKNKIGGVGFNFSLGVIATAAIMAGFFNQMVFVTLLGVLIFMSLVKGFLKVYYRNKF
ncbi:hypothetical protein K2F40_02155 [Clostridium sp. CM028]|uniref:hypothetical protein n=1 Tax=Clostridium sp. CM028 TaxID=2851575 RepID=UPI001C6F34EC|nr:hypothetical protein [Clostridium sp. CM028]MBW9147800.1 hypothetical protein [Clostridium sp. CM028]WLC61244.1 hypothetical protein KTC94_14205 [Clostridium sp. CM028]